MGICAAGRRCIGQSLPQGACPWEIHNKCVDKLVLIWKREQGLGRRGCSQPSKQPAQCFERSNARPGVAEVKLETLGLRKGMRGSCCLTEIFRIEAIAVVERF